VDDLANAGGLVEIRDIRNTLWLFHSQAMERDAELLDILKTSEESVAQLLEVAVSSKSITKPVSGDVRGISEQVFHIEFHNVVQFFAPRTPPDEALLKTRYFARRDPNPSLSAQQNLNNKRTLENWVVRDQSSLLVVRMHLRAQK
jgi:hypothetical protein